jgi:hypothetical protein
VDKRGGEGSTAGQVGTLRQDYKVEENRIHDGGRRSRAGRRIRSTEAFEEWCAGEGRGRSSSVCESNLRGTQTRTAWKVETHTRSTLAERTLCACPEIQTGEDWELGVPSLSRRRNDKLGHARRVLHGRYTSGSSQVFPVRAEWGDLSVHGPAHGLDLVPVHLPQVHAPICQVIEEERLEDPRLCGRPIGYLSGGPRPLGTDCHSENSCNVWAGEEGNQGLLGTNNEVATFGADHRFKGGDGTTHSREKTTIHQVGKQATVSKFKEKENSGVQTVAEISRGGAVSGHRGARAAHLGAASICAHPTCSKEGGTAVRSPDQTHRPNVKMGGDLSHMEALERANQVAGNGCLPDWLGSLCAGQPGADTGKQLRPMGPYGREVSYHKEGAEEHQEGSPGLGSSPGGPRLGRSDRRISCSGNYEQAMFTFPSNAKGSDSPNEGSPQPRNIMASVPAEGGDQREQICRRVVTAMDWWGTGWGHATTEDSKQGGGPNPEVPHQKQKSRRSNTPARVARTSLVQSPVRVQGYKERLFSHFGIPVGDVLGSLLENIYAQGGLEDKERAFRRYGDSLRPRRIEAFPITPHKLLIFTQYYLNTFSNAPPTFAKELGHLQMLSHLGSDGGKINDLEVDLLKRAYKRSMGISHMGEMPKKDILPVQDFLDLLGMPMSYNDKAVLWVLYLFGLRPSSFSHLTITIETNNIHITFTHLKGRLGQGPFSVQRALPAEFLKYCPEGLDGVSIQRTRQSVSNLITRLRYTKGHLTPKSFRYSLVSIARACGVPESVVQHIVYHAIGETQQHYLMSYSPTPLDKTFFSCLLAEEFIQ